MSPDHYIAQMEASIHILRHERDEARAAIARVRRLCDEEDPGLHTNYGYGYVAALADVLDALDGAE